MTSTCYKEPPKILVSTDCTVSLKNADVIKNGDSI